MRVKLTTSQGKGKAEISAQCSGLNFRAAEGSGRASAIWVEEIGFRSEVRFPVPHTGGQGEAVIVGEFPRDGLQLELVMGNVYGLAGVGQDARPDDMAVLAAVPVDVKDDSAGLRGKSQFFLDALDQIEILRAGETALRWIRIDG